MPITKLEITGLILSGGRGRRVKGLDKGWIEYQGRPLIVGQVNWLKPQVSKIVISANRNLSQYKTLNCSVLKDDDESYAGPLQGIKLALQQLETSWLFVLPVDVPNLPGSIVDSVSRNLSGTRMAYYLASEERDHYLNLIIHKSALDPLLRFLETGNARVKDFLQQINAQRLKVDIPEKQFANLNQLADYQSIV